MVLNLLTTLHQFILFICYFVYFLFKGRPEWKKLDDQDGENEIQHCCLHDQNADACKGFHERSETQQQFSKYYNTSSAPQPSTSTEASDHLQRNAVVNKSRNFAGRAKASCRKVGSATYTVLYYLFHLLFWLLKVIFGFLIWGPSSTPANDVSENLQSSFNEENLDGTATSKIVAEETEFITKQEPIFPESANVTETIDLADNDDKQNSAGNIRQRYRYESIGDSATVRSSSISPPPPSASPAGPPEFPVWKITVTSTDESAIVDSAENGTSISDPNDKIPRGAVAVLPPEITAEASVKVKEREKKIEAQKDPQPPATPNADEWTVTSSRKIQEIIPQSSKTYPIPAERISRQNSEGYPVYKLETASAKPFHYEQSTAVGTTQQDYKQKGQITDDAFFMGRSVFSPVREAEELRNSINRKALRSESVTRMGSANSRDPFYASPTPYTAYEYTAAGSPSTTAYDRSPNTAMSYYMQRSRPSQRVLRNYAYPSNTQQSYYFGSENRPNGTYIRHRSHTTEPRSSTSVSAISRHWPPRSNATGATVAKDIWTLIPPSNANVTSCKKTVEKSVTDKWITRDDDGRVVDEYAERSWKGESDGMFYRPDGTSEAWHRSLSINPGGRTTYVDNQSHFNQDFVVQSEIRNA